MQQDPGPLLPPPIDPDGNPSTRSAERSANLIRFQSELEFIQCLSNPLYLHELHTQSYFTQPEFLNYLEYLDYWRKPPYIQFITYPTSLVYLSMLRSESFRGRLGDMAFINDLTRIGRRHHETWRVTKPPDVTPKKAEKEDKLEDIEQEQEVDGDDDDGDQPTPASGTGGSGQAGAEKNKKKKMKREGSKLRLEQTPNL